MFNETTTELLNPTAQLSLGFTILCAVLAIAIAQWNKSSLSTRDYVFTIWLVFDILIHIFLMLRNTSLYDEEGPFLVLSLTGTVKSSKSFLAEPWKEYAKADARWGVADPTIISIEIITVVMATLFACLTLYGMMHQKFYRHFFQICLCVSELYGGWMTFCPEWLTGSKNLTTNSFLLNWVYLVFFNGLWVVFPLALLYQSWAALRDFMTFIDSEGLVVRVREEKTVYVKTYTASVNSSNNTNKSLKAD